MQYRHTCPLRLTGRCRLTRRSVRDGIGLAIVEIHALHLFEVEGTGTHPSKDTYLITTFIYSAVPVKTFRKRQGGPMGMIRRNQLWGGTGAKTLIPRGALRRGELEHPQTVTPIGDIEK